MATHSSVLAWRIPGTEEPGRLPSMGLHRVRHDWSDLAAVAAAAQMVKSLPAMLETWVWSLGQEDPLEKGMATHSSIPAWRTRWTEEPGGLQSMGSQSGTRLSGFTFIFNYARDCDPCHPTLPSPAQNTLIAKFMCDFYEKVGPLGVMRSWG